MKTIPVPPTGWQGSSFTSAGITHATYRKGTGPGVVIVHEIPGITPSVLAFAERVVDAGFTVIMPLLAKLKEKSDQARMRIGNKKTGI